MNSEDSHGPPDPGNLWRPSQSDEVQSSTDGFVVSGAEIVFSNGHAYSGGQSFNVVAPAAGYQSAAGHVVYAAAPGFQINTSEVIYQHAHSTYGRISPEDYAPGSPPALPVAPASPTPQYQHVVHQSARGLAQNLAFSLPIIFEHRQPSSPLIGSDSRALSQSPLAESLIGPDQDGLNQSPLSVGTSGAETQRQGQAGRVFSPSIGTLSKVPIHGYTAHISSSDAIIQLDDREEAGHQSSGSPEPGPSRHQIIHADVLRISQAIEDGAERLVNEPDTTQTDHVTPFIAAGEHGTAILDRDSLMVSDLVNFSSSHLQRESQEHSHKSQERLVAQNSAECSAGIDSDLQSHVRKSSRLLSRAERAQERAQSLTVREYEPTPYKPEQLWCEECMKSYLHACPDHKLSNIIDKVVLSRAWASLPGALQIFKIQGNTLELGVFAKKPVPRRTQFGPFVAETVMDKDQLPQQRILYRIDYYKPPHKVVYLDATDEYKCNWMMFVRPAQNFREQNVVAYQYQTDIYFTVTRNIEPREELKVWYAAHYAHHLGLSIHYPTEEDIDAINEKENKWPCFECSRRFKSSAQLQAHLGEHEREEVDRREQEVTQRELGEHELSHRDIAHQATSYVLKQHDQCPPDHTDPINHGNHTGLHGNDHESTLLGNTSVVCPVEGGDEYLVVNVEDVVGVDVSDSDKRRNNFIKPPKKRNDHSLTNWKKKKSALYLNRLKSSQKSRAERNTLFKQCGTEGEQEWVCTHCSLTFDNSNLLNLHTLTHAAEDVGLEEMLSDMSGKLTTDDPILDSRISIKPVTTFSCPVCNVEFQNKKDLIDHASYHGKVKPKETVDKKKYRCARCWKGFLTDERLQRHMLVHGSDDLKPFQCKFCNRRFMNKSALTCHLKIHSEKKFFQCLLCDNGFALLVDMKAHAVTHQQNGLFKCPKCSEEFKEYSRVHKHIKLHHPLNTHDCNYCEKKFTRPDKLRLHLLKHSNHREYMCETCGKQFKRKDKLKEHIEKIHSEEREIKKRQKPPPTTPKFVPKVDPQDYNRFIYKCQICVVGFKRRGMLVNHLANRHPEVRPEAIPELNLPILKTQREFYCAYCDKVYKSSTKRKVHILKNHPGAELPASSRRNNLIEETMGINMTYSQTVGSVTTMPHSCSYCHKQYASKAKLLQHERSKHPGLQRSPHEHESKRSVEQALTSLASGSQEQSDLLTQAMSELTQTLVVGDYRLANSNGQFRPAEIQLTVSQQGEVTVPDPSQLSQLLQSAQFQQGAVQLQVPVSDGEFSQQHVVTIPVSSSGLASLQNDTERSETFSANTTAVLQAFR